jgi:tetratricopeptide (TPR) repeat protein
VVAQDVFVHHFGSRTFVGNGIDLRGHLEENKRLFEEKWGISRPVDEGRIVEAEKLQLQGRTLVEQGDLVEAAKMFTQSIRLQPQNALCFNDLGVTLFQLGRVNDARKNLQRALLLDPNLDDARLNLEAIDRMPIPA